MEKDYIVSLFGHREIADLDMLEQCFLRQMQKILDTYEHITLLIGRNGEFDECIASSIKRLQKRVGEERITLTLVVPYSLKSLVYYENYYDEIIIPEELARLHPKQKITKRNQWMVKNSDLVLAYLRNDHGGAYAAVRYALSIGKPVSYMERDTKDD